MDASHARREGFFWPTVDLLLAAFGVGIVAYPLAAGLFDVVGIPGLTPRSLTVIVAFAGSYPFVAGHWSLGTLGDYILVWMGALLTISLLAFPVAVLVGGVPEGARRTVEVVLFGLAHLTAVVAVLRYGVAPTRYV